MYIIPLEKVLSDFLAKERECSILSDSIFLEGDKLRVKQSDSLYVNHISLLTFIHHRRKKMITKGMKAAVRKGKYSYKLIKRLYYMFV